MEFERMWLDQGFNLILWLEKMLGVNLVKDTRDSVWACGCIWFEFPNCLRILGGIKPDVVPCDFCGDLMDENLVAVTSDSNLVAVASIVMLDCLRTLVGIKPT